ncbi:hypothetical protein BGY98DRAFT_937021 [Russula aff. rugulosa BPL654]|nr:hypothetical protein BGY98DRAFT_937021 [Russula aff. rugulosa BPL654]
MCIWGKAPLKAPVDGCDTAFPRSIAIAAGRLPLVVCKEMSMLRGAGSESKTSTASLLPLKSPGQGQQYPVAKDGHAARHINLANTTPDELEKLAQACEVLDETEHNAGKMDTECFSSTLDPFRTDLIKIIHGYLLEAPATQAKYIQEGLILQASRQHSAKRKNIWIALVVFPTYYEGGTLFLRRHGHEWIFDSGQALSGGALDRPSIGYVAFLNDIEQDVAPVTSGHCVTLTYNLYFDDDGGPVSEKDAISEHLIPPNHQIKMDSNPEFMAEGGTLAFGLRHGYPMEQIGLRGVCNNLKGSDAVVYQSTAATFTYRSHGGIPVCQGGGSIYNNPYSGTDQFENPEAVEWVTPVTKYSRQEGIFVTRDDSTSFSGHTGTYV